MNKASAIANAKIVISSIDWYVPHYTHSMEQQAIISEQILGGTLTELQHVEGPSFMKKLFTQNLWHFELASQKGIKVPFGLTVRLQQRNRQKSQNLKNVTFHRLIVTSAQCKIGTEKYHNAGIIIIYDNDDYSQGYGCNKGAFGTLARDNFLQPYIFDHDSKSSNHGTEVGYNLHVFDI